MSRLLNRLLALLAPPLPPGFDPASDVDVRLYLYAPMSVPQLF